MMGGAVSFLKNGETEMKTKIAFCIFFLVEGGQHFYSQRFVAIIYELINTMSLSIRLLENYYQIQYSYLCTNPQLLNTATPSANFVIHVDILINNNTLTTKLLIHN